MSEKSSGITGASVAIMCMGIGSMVFITAKIKRKVDEINQAHDDKVKQE